MPLISTKREAVANQLREYAGKTKTPQIITEDSGNPIPEKDASLTVGVHGPILLQDITQVEELAHFDRERIPERVVHAKGGGAFGYFEVTHDITSYTCAKIFSTIGKRTPLVARFSQVINESGSSDTVRDPRGFAIKFRTEDGNWDLVGNNTPVFFVRDSVMFPSFIHSQKRNPVTNIRNWDAYWDFLSLRPESMHQVMVVYSDRGIPDGYRYMHGYGSNTFSMIDSDGKVSWVKFHYRSDQGIRNIFADQARILAGVDADYSVRDLYNAIARGDYPSWTLSIQVMTPEEASRQPYDPFDVSKTWPHADFPLIPVGKITLNKNPSNYFAEIEQLAFNPSHFIPGIDASPDRMLQGRLFSYGDTHRYRLGVNHQQLPVNAPLVPIMNFNRSGRDIIDSQGGAPNYHPNSFHGPEASLRAKKLTPSFRLVGDTTRTDTSTLEDNYTQPRVLYQRVLPEGEKARLVDNVAYDLRNAAGFIQERMINGFKQVDLTLGALIADAVHKYNHPKSDPRAEI
ncbi:LOW QUALITY PROTEIN: catalase-like [Atheta coriaria]|uniref:LOW QUALITY PROTEIN: catalase-like n=1 Tax=Dalotia coriaria TaxID=877792 RepID=UPI0031F41BF1